MTREEFKELSKLEIVKALRIVEHIALDQAQMSDYLFSGDKDTLFYACEVVGKRHKHPTPQDYALMGKLYPTEVQEQVQNLVEKGKTDKMFFDLLEEFIQYNLLSYERVNNTTEVSS